MPEARGHPLIDRHYKLFPNQLKQYDRDYDWKQLLKDYLLLFASPDPAADVLKQKDFCHSIE